ncbi:MAG: hypothetical protein KF817_05700 [Phycisphaeraceae bacterium]|nr:hypothetical protein [Phycisphaeraceae bacterium]
MNASLRLLALMTAVLATSRAHGDGAVVHTCFDLGYCVFRGHHQKAFAAWSDAMDNDIVTMTFTEVPMWTWLSDHYNAIGVWFTDGYDQVVVQGNYLNDTVGVSGHVEIIMELDASVHGVAMHTRQEMQAWFYDGNRLLFQTYLHSPQVTGPGPDERFVGFITDVPFNRVRLRRDGWGISVDDIHLQRVIDPVPADVNGDGVVDFMDLLLVLAWFGPCPSQDLLPGCAAADLDGNGVVDLADIVAVIYTWTG